MFCRDGKYYEYDFEAKTGEIKETSSVNMRELKIETNNEGGD